MVFVTVLKAKHRRCEQHEQRPVSRPLPWSRKKSCYQLPKKSKSWCIRTRAGRFLPCCGPEFAIWWRDYRSSSVEGFAGFERWKSLQSGLAIAWECGRTSSASVVFVWTSYSFVIEFKLHCHFFFVFCSYDNIWIFFFFFFYMLFSGHIDMWVVFISLNKSRSSCVEVCWLKYNIFCICIDCTSIYYGDVFLKILLVP